MKNRAKATKVAEALHTSRLLDSIPKKGTIFIDAAVADGAMPFKRPTTGYENMEIRIFKPVKFQISYDARNGQTEEQILTDIAEHIFDSLGAQNVKFII